MNARVDALKILSIPQRHSRQVGRLLLFILDKLVFYSETRRSFSFRFK